MRFTQGDPHVLPNPWQTGAEEEQAYRETLGRLRHLRTELWRQLTRQGHRFDSELSKHKFRDP